MRRVINPKTSFNLNLDEFIEQRIKEDLTVFCGPNNCGKSYLLKSISEKLGETAIYMGTQRIFNIHQLNSQQRDDSHKSNRFSNFLSNFRNSNENTDNYFYDINSIIVELSNEQRQTLFTLMSELIGSEFQIKNLDSDNSLSPFYVDVNGMNLSFTSTGTRLLLTIIGTLLSSSYEIFLIDEPELGLNPKIQNVLINFLLNKKNRERYFSHIKHIFISTHSHIFLDRDEIKNNYKVTKESEIITIQQILNINEFHNLQFNLLGNTFESMFLPSIMILVEGITDHPFINRLINLHFPNNKITCDFVNGDGQIMHRVHAIDKMLDGIDKSPYANRIIVILDKVHMNSLPDQLEKKGIQKENILIWSRNGIEYYYPEEIMSEIYSTKSLDDLKIESDIVELNGIKLKKTELNKKVLERLNDKSTVNQEIDLKLFQQLKDILN